MNRWVVLVAVVAVSGCAGYRSQLIGYEVEFPSESKVAPESQEKTVEGYRVSSIAAKGQAARYGVVAVSPQKHFDDAAYKELVSNLQQDGWWSSLGQLPAVQGCQAKEQPTEVARGRFRGAQREYQCERGRVTVRALAHPTGCYVLFSSNLSNRDSTVQDFLESLKPPSAAPVWSKSDEGTGAPSAAPTVDGTLEQVKVAISTAVPAS